MALLIPHPAIWLKFISSPPQDDTPIGIYINQTTRLPMQNQTDLLSEETIPTIGISRKKLLPLWIKIFMWIFLVFSAAVPVIIIFGIIGYPAQLAVYGLQTTDAFSGIGLIILAVFIIKGIVSIGLLTNKAWAIKAGIADAVIGISICVFVMVYTAMYYHNVSIRLELIALIPYLVKFLKIKNEWESI
jgi:hypothetical protein